MDNLKIAGVLGGALSPDIVLLIGFISDLMNLKFRFSATSLIGISAVVLHWIVGGAIFGFSKSVTSAVASTASAVTSAIVSTPTPAATQMFGVGDPSAPSVSPAAVVASAITSPPGGPVLKGIAAPNRARAVATGNPSDVSTLGSSVMGKKKQTSDDVAQAEAAKLTSGIVGPTGIRTSRDKKSKKQGGGSMPDYITQKFNPCAIRGLGYFDIQGSPMGLAALSAIFMVYLLDMTVGNKRSGAQVGGYVGFSAAVFLLNIYAYRELKCVDTSTTTASLKALALPLVVGLLSGTGGYYVLKNNYADILPLDGTHFDDGTGGGQQATRSSSQAHCNAPNDEGQMVCEAYQDGKRITTVPVK